MKIGQEKCSNFIQSIIGIGVVAVLFILFGAMFDFYYDLNDDVLIKDIVAGAYSGTPDAHNHQMLYPISLLISVCYRIVPTLPWFGLFLCVCHVGAVGLVVQRTYQLLKKSRLVCAVTIATELITIVSLLLWEFIYVQYTVTCAVLVAGACFLTYINSFETVDDWRSFLKINLPSVILLLIALNIRSEMFLLMCPFVAFVGVVMWIENAKPGKLFRKELTSKYGSLIVTIVAVFLVSIFVDAIAYRSDAWQEYRDFFNARTQVYDYTWYPSYEEASDFYHEIGLEEAQVALIDNYNFGIDKEICGDTLWSIAEYAEQTNIKEPFLQRIKAALVDYKWRSFHDQDAPHNYIVWATYLLCIVICICNRDKSAIWRLPLLLVFRTIPWMYVILAKRVPTRISHPLYYIEFVVLLAIMMRGVSKQKGWLLGILAIFSLIQLYPAVTAIEIEQERREQVNEQVVLFDDYAKQNSENYYYLDVYSTVAFSEKMFQNVDNRLKNYSIMGGWGAKSPLQKEITMKFAFGTWNDGPTAVVGSMSVAEQLLLENFYFVIEQGGDVSFLEDFYATQNMRIFIELEESVGEFNIYSIRADYDRE